MRAARSIAPYALLVVVGVALFGRTLDYDFNHRDDDAILVRHHAFFARASNLPRVVTDDVLGRIAGVPHGGYYRPVLLASFFVDAQVGGAEPWAYRATNVALHLAVCAAVLAFLGQLGVGRGRATLMALLLCVHPALAVVPAWIPCRNDSLLALFAIGALASGVALLRRGGAGWLAACLACLGLALFTKESALALLALGPLFALALRTGRRDEARDLWRLRIGAVALLAAYVAMRQHVLGSFPVGVRSAFENLSALPVYLGKALFPVGLSFTPTPQDSLLWPGFVATLALALAAAATGRRLVGLPGIGLAWAFAFLAPALLPASDTWGLENRLYLPAIGGLLFVATALPAPLPRPTARIAGALGVAVAVAFAALTWQRLPAFADGVRYWESAVETSPHSRVAWSSLALLHLEQERHAEAERVADAALERFPADADLQLLRGTLHQRASEWARAEARLRRALDLDPENRNAAARLRQVERRLSRGRAD